MKSYSQWLKDSNPGNYSAVGITGLPLDLVAGIVGTPNTKPHATLMYSKNSGVPLATVQAILDKHNIEGQEATVKGVNVFPDSSSPDKSALVLELEHPGLAAIHQDLLSVGCKHSFSPFCPHATLAYGVDTNTAHDLAKSLHDKISGMKLGLSGFENNHVNENWVATLNKE